MRKDTPFARFVSFVAMIVRRIGAVVSIALERYISYRLQVFLLCVAIAGTVFVGDVMLPMGVASGVPYLGVVLVALWSPLRRDTIVAAVVCSVLTILGFRFSAIDSAQWQVLVHWLSSPIDAVPDDPEFWNVLANRTLAVSVVWVTAILGLRRKQEAERIRLVVESAPDGLVMVNELGKIVLANSKIEKLFGYRRDELIGQPIEKLLPFRFRDKHPQFVAEFFANPATRQMGPGREILGLPKGGTEFPIEVGLTPIKMDEGMLVLSTVVDITERKLVEAARKRAEDARRQAARELKALNETLEERVTLRTVEVKERAAELARANAELERSNLELQHFAYIASHDLQEPLRMVGNYCQLLKRRYYGKFDQDANEFIDFAVDGAKRSQAMVEDLLTYSRVDTQAKPYESTDCNVLVELAIRNLAASIEGTGAKVTYEMLPTVMADRSQLAQVFQNLIGNAVKFHGERPPLVHVAARREEDDWLIWVTDNGIGMEPQYTEQIFVIFKRLQGRDKYPGTGIGLAICKRVIERLNGKIWVDTAPGEGSTFYFTIPVSRNSDGQTPESSPVELEKVSD